MIFYPRRAIIFLSDIFLMILAATLHLFNPGKAFSFFSSFFGLKDKEFIDLLAEMNH
jgi:hypothetical protein